MNSSEVYRITRFLFFYYYLFYLFYFFFSFAFPFSGIILVFPIFRHRDAQLYQNIIFKYLEMHEVHFEMLENKLQISENDFLILENDF